MCVIDKLIEGTYSNILPTMIGVFLGLWLTELVKNYNDKRLFRKILDSSVIELYNLIGRNKTYVAFLKNRTVNNFASSPTDFVKINMQSFPTNIDLIASSQTNKYVKISLINAFLTEKNNLEVIKQRLKIDQFSHDNDVIATVDKYNEVMLDLIWIIYQISRDTKIDKFDNCMQLLVDYINQNKDNDKLDLHKKILK